MKNHFWKGYELLETKISLFRSTLVSRIFSEKFRINNATMPGLRKSFSDPYTYQGKLWSYQQPSASVGSSCDQQTLRLASEGRVWTFVMNEVSKRYLRWLRNHAWIKKIKVKIYFEELFMKKMTLYDQRCVVVFWLRSAD